MPAFGKQMASLRMAQGLTRDDLAVRIGVHPNSIAGWENGRNEPTVSKFAAIARELGVSLDDLWGAGAASAAGAAS